MGSDAMAYKVFDLVGKFALSSGSGQDLYEIIHASLKDKKSVKIDFSNVEVVAASFLNAAVGQLLKDFDTDYLNNSLELDGLNEAGQAVLRQVIKNAKRYYSDVTYQEAVDSTTRDYAASL